jgi:hypothetical protein
MVDLKINAKRLVLKRKDLRQNTAALFEELAKDQNARDEFIRNPTGQLVSRVTKQTLPAQQISDANRILFAIMANDEFREWLDNYQTPRSTKKVTEAQFSRDFAEALLKFGDSDLLGALFKYASDGFGLPGFGPVAEQLVIGPDKAVATSPATPSTSDKSANSSQNFNSNTRQTGLNLGDRLNVDPAFMRAIINNLLAHARELKAAGKLTDLNNHLL